MSSPQQPTRDTRGGRNGERGVALLVALMAMLLVMALGTALVLAASIESKLTRNFRHGAQALYAADAVLERAVDELGAMPDWNAVLTGAVSSSFVDGPPGGTRTLADGRPIDPGEIVNQANCRQPTACAGSTMDAVTAGRPWGANNPRWQPFAWGALDDLLPAGRGGSPFYVVAMVADDPSETDGDPLADGAAPCAPGGAGTCNPGTGLLALRAEAFGPYGAHKILELTIARRGSGERRPDYNSGIDQAGVRILSWRELR